MQDVCICHRPGYLSPVDWAGTGEPTLQKQRGKWVIRQSGYDPATGRRRVRQLDTFDTRRERDLSDQLENEVDQLDPLESMDFLKGEPSRGVCSALGIVLSELPSRIHGCENNSDDVAGLSRRRLLLGIPPREHTDDRSHRGAETSFLLKFPDRSCFGILPPFHSAAGHRPLAVIRVARCREAG